MSAIAELPADALVLIGGYVVVRWEIRQIRKEWRLLVAACRSLRETLRSFR